MRGRSVTCGGGSPLDATATTHVTSRRQEYKARLQILQEKCELANEIKDTVVSEAAPWSTTQETNRPHEVQAQQFQPVNPRLDGLQQVASSSFDKSGRRLRFN